jgi:cellulose synthase/poly-beta-1,6-N-acetylglucosamine synthase-like glycosyltransferase
MQDLLTSTIAEPLQRWPFSVTIAMPAFNEGHGIAAVIAAVRAEVPEAEVLVIDDASSDNTRGWFGIRTTKATARRSKPRSAARAPMCC